MKADCRRAQLKAWGQLWRAAQRTPTNCNNVKTLTLPFPVAIVQAQREDVAEQEEARVLGGRKWTRFAADHLHRWPLTSSHLPLTNATQCNKWTEADRLGREIY